MQRTHRTRKLTFTLEVLGDEDTNTIFDGLHGRIIDAVHRLEERSTAGENCVIHARVELTETNVHEDTGGPF